MASQAAAPTRGTRRAGIARRAAFHKRLRTERAELEAAAGAGLPPIEYCQKIERTQRSPPDSGGAVDRTDGSPSRVRASSVQ